MEVRASTCLALCDRHALKNSRRMDIHFETASQICVNRLQRIFRPWEVDIAEDQVKAVLLVARNHEEFLRFECIAPVAYHMSNIDSFITHVNRRTHSASLGLIVHLPGVSFDEAGPSRPIRFFGPSVAKGQTPAPQFILLCRRLRHLCSYAFKLRDIVDGQGTGVFHETLKSLMTLWDGQLHPDHVHSTVHQKHLTYLMEQ
ncbi:hypothetical protein H4582DRAFT_708483 [Lactarius indigo]|nr:hypothetical protein H4582DRAFT_708483 [Lactarius indigo]